MSEQGTEEESIFDFTRSDPELATLRSHVEALRWTEASDALKEIRSRGVDQLVVALEAISRVPRIEGPLHEILVAHPDDVGARSLALHRRLTLARHIRDEAVPVGEGQDEFEVYEAMWRQVELELIQICAEHPRAELPWFLRLASAADPSINPHEARRRYERLTLIRPPSLQTQQKMLYKLAPHSGGTSDQLSEFANECVNQAPPGALSKAAVAVAHFEMVASMAPWETELHLSLDQVRNDIRRAEDDTVEHPEHVPDLADVPLRGLFAILWSLADCPEKAAPHFRALGNRVSPDWWDRFGDARAVFETLRDGAFAKDEPR